MAAADRLYLIDLPAMLDAEGIDALINALDPNFVRQFPNCMRCARPLVILGVKYEPIIVYSNRSQVRCRLCSRRWKAAYEDRNPDRRRKAKEEQPDGEG